MWYHLLEISWIPSIQTSVSSIQACSGSKRTVKSFQNIPMKFNFLVFSLLSWRGDLQNFWSYYPPSCVRYSRYFLYRSHVCRNQQSKDERIVYCFLATRRPLNVDAGAFSSSGPRSPSSSQIAAWSPTSIFNRTTLAPPPPTVDATFVHSSLFDPFFFRTNLWTEREWCRYWVHD